MNTDRTLRADMGTKSQHHMGFVTSPILGTSKASTYVSTPPFRRARRPIKCPKIPKKANAPSMQIAEDSEDIADVPDTDTEERLRRFHELGGTSISFPPSVIPVPGEGVFVEVEFAEGKTMRFETGRVSRQALGSIIARIGGTLVFCTACGEKKSKSDIDFFPLRVDYAEKFSATGRTPGSYIKREGRPSEREILISRLVDRPLRPMFPDGYFNEVQVLANVFSYDGKNPADALAICGSAAALHISSIPLVEPVAGVRVSCVDGKFIVEPTIEEQNQSTADIVVAGTRKGILMIEGVASFLPEAEILKAVQVAHESIIKLCDAMDELREKAGKEKDQSKLRVVPSELMIQIENLMGGLDEALAVRGKQDRDAAVRIVREKVFAELLPSRQQEIEDPDAAAQAKSILQMAWKEAVSECMRRCILDNGIRADGRGLRGVRPITIDQGLLPGAHGSSLFTRGETQALAVATLGGEDMAQKRETLEGEEAARFYLQYSFPPSSVGEVGRVGPPGRREVGHGKLAERALAAAVPSREAFPYIIRVESNILESNGSSSMASVCGGCLALLDAGVPLTRHVAGIAMGLIVDKRADGDVETGEKRNVVLTDILGLEDALGSCDAKFAGDEIGISALQLDVKLRGISMEVFNRILQQARQGRIHVLDEMKKAMPAARPSLPDTVPRVRSIVIPQKRIGDVIGPGGKTIKSIIERCGGEDILRITIENDGVVSFASANDQALNKAMDIVKGLTVTMSVGTTFSGKVTKTLPFGAYVEVAEGKEGWLHISELENKRTDKVEDVCNVGDKIQVKVIELGRNGQFKLSRRACLPKEKPARTTTVPAAVEADGSVSNSPGSKKRRTNSKA